MSINCARKRYCSHNCFPYRSGNCTSAIHLGKSKLINGIILYSFKRYLYNQVRYVHCPSQMAADLMKKHHFKNNEARVISDHKFCATKEFALDKEHCLFKAGSPKDLMQKIEWFYEHPEEIIRLREIHLQEADKYAHKPQVDALEQLFFDAYNEQKEGKDLHSVKPRRKDKRLLKGVYRKAKKQAKHPEKYQ